MSKKFTNPDDIDNEREEAEKRLKYLQEEKKKREKEKEKPEKYTIYPKHFIDNIDNNNNVDANIDLNIKTKRKRLEISKTFDDENQSLITHGDKTFLDLKQQELAKEFFQKFVDNDNLYIFKKYEHQGKETSILLNLPQDKEVFNDFIRNTYKPVLTSQHGVMDYTNFKQYFTKTIQNVKQIINEVTAVFVESGSPLLRCK
jgi:hypothetical protein